MKKTIRKIICSLFLIVSAFVLTGCDFYDVFYFPIRPTKSIIFNDIEKVSGVKVPNEGKINGYFNARLSEIDILSPFYCIVGFKNEPTDFLTDFTKTKQASSYVNGYFKLVDDNEAFKMRIPQEKLPPRNKIHWYYEPKGTRAHFYYFPDELQLYYYEESLNVEFNQWYSGY